MPASSIVAPVVPTTAAQVRLRPIGIRDITVAGGLWAERRRVNREVTIPHGARQLEAAGNLANLRAAAAGAGAYSGDADDSGLTFAFLDSDVHKWLEAVGWELGRVADAELARTADEMIELVAGAQREDGYLNSYFQLMTPGRAFHDLEWGHELYTIGHLVQAAIAWKRSLGDDRLLHVATRAVRRVGEELGPGGRELIDGHPELEMALVELYRTTGDEEHLELASTLVERRGRGLLEPDRFGPEYWQDHEQVRHAREPIGHAVRQLYLDCGAVDLAVETGDRELLEAVLARWEVMVASRTYLTGGLGSRQRDEAFGEAYELPPDVAYAETCAAIASVMLSWRLLLATGDPRHADLIERTSLNAVLPGLALDGSHFFYANPLQVRSGASRESRGPTATRRRPWFPCACCPPNLMRFLATVNDLVATVDDDGVTVHQFVSGAVEAEVGGKTVAIEMTTDYPWSGRLAFSIAAGGAEPWTLAVRLPSWCRSGSWAIGESTPEPIEPDTGLLRLTRPWRPGDSLRLELDMPPRITVPDARIDAVRGSIAIERGPLVYAVEEGDLPEGATLETIVVDPSAPPTIGASDPELPGMTMLEVGAWTVEVPPDEWPYASGSAAAPPATGPFSTRAVPYFAWGNRRPGGLRVWLPMSADRPYR